MSAPDPDDEFVAWVGDHSPRLVGFGYLLCHDRELAQDLVQESLAQLHGHWARVSERGNPDAYEAARHCDSDVEQSDSCVAGRLAPMRATRRRTQQSEAGQPAGSYSEGDSPP